jgi:hypothetical protein
MFESPVGAGPSVPAGAEDMDPALRIARARGRLLQLAVFGGALLGAFIGQVVGAIATDQTPDMVSPSAIVSLVAGYVAGYLVGRLTVAFEARRHPDGSLQWSGILSLLLATPAYLVAGEVAGGVGFAVAGISAAAIGDGLRGTLVALLVAWVALAPLTLAFTPSTTGRPKVMHRTLAGCSGTLWVGAFTAVWFLGSLMAVLAVLATIQQAVPAAFERAGDGPQLMIITLAAWLILWAGGSAAVYRLVRSILAGRT